MAKGLLGVVALVATMGVVITGCGGSGGSGNDEASENNPQTSSTEAEGGIQNATNGTLTVKMGDFFFEPNLVNATAGKVKIDAPNEGKVPHELVLLQTNQDPAKLKLKSNGEVDEEAYKSPGEIGETAAGVTGKKTFTNLKAGNYAMICNLPGHYKSGMYGKVTVLPSKASTAPAKNLNVDMGDFFFKPKDLTAAAGKVKITAPNKGNVPHELVLLQTNQDPANLKVKSNGEVDEEAYKSPGEIGETANGATGKKTFNNLKAGSYAMICNLPGHYKAGMYGSLKVE